MQKAYSRINWENDPSTNTPLGENNLNKMDKAIDTIDDRVLSLYGYESRVAASETNAKASETNAKTSEINAKQSELLAKLYMENAFSGTPEGYEKLVEDVRLMDIKTTTDTTLANSVAGGLKINSMSGKSVQNGTPTPDTPIAIQNVGDCVEMEQGSIYSSSGALADGDNRVRSKQYIPCKSGDNVAVILNRTADWVFIYCYDDNNNYIQSEACSVDTSTNTYSATIPSNATMFKFVIGTTDAITPDTVGKIALTINDKYVVQIINRGDDELADLQRVKGYFLTATGEESSSSQWSYKMLEIDNKYNYLITNTTTDALSPKHCWYDSNMNFISAIGFNGIKEMVVTPPSNAKYLGVSIWYSTESYAQKQTVATILLAEPLRQDDGVYKDNGVWYVERNRGNAKIPQLEWYTSGVAVDRYYMPLTALGFTNIDITKAIICTHFARSTSGEQVGVFVTSSGNIGFALGEKGTTTVDDFNALLSSEDVCLEYTFATPTIEELDTDSQIALNSLVTFDDVTYIVVDSRVQPSGIESEYGTSKVGAYTLKSLLNSENNAIKYNELAVALLATESGV